MTTAREVITYVERSTGHPLNHDEGVHHGPADAPVEAAAVSWMATADALTSAAADGARLVIGHESLYYPYDAVVRSDNPEGWEAWPTNARRRELLERHGMTFLRVHGSMDELTILDEFSERLGLPPPVEAEGYVRIFEIEPCTLGELVERVKARVGMEHVRVSRPDLLGRTVRRLGLPWGGLGLFVNVSFQEDVLSRGVDALIAGESDSYGFRFAGERGVPMIETSHEASEMPGVRRFAEALGAEFPDLRVRFVENRPSWVWR